jgi:class 3 adenylate cyclase/tetratricopeptide (TPR) repeat protein
MTGTAGSPSETLTERKVVTLLFADLTGYTALAASMDPEDVYGFVRPAMEDLRRTVEGFGGSVPQVLGDGFMAVFGVPLAHEDDAERAVRAALAVRDRIRQLNADRAGPPLPEVHAGVNSGEVMVAPAVEAAGFAVVGDVVNTAARMSDLAKPGSVLVDAGTRERTRHAIRYGKRQDLRAKGKPAPIAAFPALVALTELPAGRPSGRVTLAFVGRERELERLSSEYRRALDTGRSRVVVVTGEPGAGKSRLVEEFAGRHPEATWIAGRCIAYGQQRPLFPIAGPLGEVLGTPTWSRPASSGSSASVTRLVGDRERAREVGRAVRSLARASTDVVVRGNPGAALGAAVRWLRIALEGLASARSVVVVVDDLQWADPELIDLIRAVARNPWSGPILFLGLSRPEPFEGVRDLTTVRLRAMPDQHLRLLAEGALLPGVESDTLQRIVSRARGNPLFLEESISMLVEAGGLVREAGPWHVREPEALEQVPVSLRTLVAARLDGLPAVEKQVLQDASISGEVTWDALLSHLGGDAEPGPAIERLVRRGLLRRRRRSAMPGTSELAFKHVVIRDVAYGSLPRRERAVRHLTVATWLRAQARRGREPVAELAHHYEQAWDLARTRTGGQADLWVGSEAVRYLGRWADDTFPFQGRLAEALYGRALAIAEQMPAVAGSEDMAHLLTGRAESLIDLGRHDSARSFAVRARSAAVRSGQDELVARALLSLGRIESDIGDPGRARRHLSEALARFEMQGDLSGQGLALHRLAETWATQDYPRVLEYMRMAFERFADANDRIGRAMIVRDLAYLLSTVGGTEFRRWFREARQLLVDEVDLRARASLLRTWGYYCYYAGRHGDAIDAMRRARPLAADAGDRYAEADALAIEALAHSNAGSPAGADRLAQEAAALGREVDSHRITAMSLVAGARAALRGGDPARASRQLGRARVLMSRPRPRTELLEIGFATAGLALDRGDWSRIRRPAERAAIMARAAGWRLFEPLGFLMEGRAAMGAGHVHTAIPDLETAVRLARATGAEGTLMLADACLTQARLLSGSPERTAAKRTEPDPEVLAILAENDGLRSLLRGDHIAAAVALESAVRAWEGLGLTAWLGRARAMLAGVQRGAGHGRAAASNLSKARRVLDRLGTPERARPTLLAAVAPPPVSSRRRAAGD